MLFVSTQMVLTYVTAWTAHTSNRRIPPALVCNIKIINFSHLLKIVSLNDFFFFKFFNTCLSYAVHSFRTIYSTKYCSMNRGFKCFEIFICMVFCLQMPMSVYWKLQNVPPILNVLILTLGTRVNVPRVTKEMDPFARVCLLFNISLLHTMIFFLKA